MKANSLFSNIIHKLNVSFNLWIICLWLILFCIANSAMYAGEMTDARINIGLKLFRAILAADLQIKTKTNNDNELPLLIVYKNNSVTGQKFAENLMQLGKKNTRAKIKNIPIKVTYISYHTFPVGQHEQPAGIFLVDKMSMQELAPITSYAIKNKIITYSPFEGDVQKNITAGLAIGARVRPIINMKTLKESDIQIKSFFLKVAKKYEP